MKSIAVLGLSLIGASLTLALLNGAIYFQYGMAHFTVLPSSSDPYALAHPGNSPDNEARLLHPRLVNSCTH